MALTQVIGRGLGTQTTLAGSNTLVLDTDGIMTKPLQPAFSAHKNGTDQSNVSTGAHTTITWSTERFDVNSDFASNTFTAPVTGKYQFNLNLRLDNVDSAANYYVFKIITSNQEYRTIFDPDFGQDQAYWFVLLSVIADMDASDTAYATMYQDGGTAQTDIDGSASYTYFTGCLVC